jgi:hypothetical protein
MSSSTHTGSTSTDGGENTDTSMKAKLIGAWLFVGVPLTYGIVQTVRRATALFTG